jgi:hypothetical protein
MNGVGPSADQRRLDVIADPAALDLVAAAQRHHEIVRVLIIDERRALVRFAIQGAGALSSIW